MAIRYADRDREVPFAQVGMIECEGIRRIECQVLDCGAVAVVHGCVEVFVSRISERACPRQNGSLVDQGIGRKGNYRIIFQDGNVERGLGE